MFVTFTNPKYLFFLLAIPLLILIHFSSFKRYKKKALKFANFDAMSRINGIQFFSRNLTILYLSIILIFCLSLAASGMNVQITKSASSFSFVINIDASYSMETNDVLPSRLDAAKIAAKNFVDYSPLGTKIGIVSFSGTPFIQQDITANKDPIKEAIGRIEISRVGGTSILNAMIASGNMLLNEDAKSVVIVSDGQISVDTVKEIVDYAIRNGIVINTIGVGTVTGAETSIGFISKLDEEALQSIAYETGGFFSLVTAKDEFDNAMQQVLKISKKRVMLDARPILILIALIIFVAIFFLNDTKYRNIP